jgi:hypothetical protein
MLWEKRCAEADAEDIDSPIAEVHETKLIEGDGGYEIYQFDMEEDDELVFSIDANDFLDISRSVMKKTPMNGPTATTMLVRLIIARTNLEDEDEGDDDEGDEDDRPLPPGYWHKTNVIAGDEYRFVAEGAGSYVLLLVNWDDDPTEVTVDAAVWSAETS